MKGLLFKEGCGGKSDEYITAIEHWCIEVGNKKYHVDYRRTTFTYKSPEEIFEVTPCDESCQNIQEIPDDVLEKALLKIKSL